MDRRTFHRLALAATGGILAPQISLLAQQQVETQPFVAQVRRLLAALQMIGSPLAEEEEDSLQQWMLSAAAAAAQRIMDILDRHVLLVVTLNPEMRVAATRGPARAEVHQGGWCVFLAKVLNSAGTTPVLRFKSPQGQSVGRRSSLAIEGVHDFTNGAVDLVEARERWLALDAFDQPPMTSALSGLAVEYRILQIYSRDAGKREATLQPDAGWGEQDLGYRSSVPILFNCKAACPVRVQVLDEHGKPSIAALTIRDDLGRTYPPQQKREMPDLNFQPQIYRYSGETLSLPPGTYQVEYTRGPEYLARKKQFVVEASTTNEVQLELSRWISPAEQGYYSGDTHIHAAGCSHYESPTEGVVPIVMQRQVDGEALDLGSVLNWGPGFAYQKQFFTGHVAAAVQPMRQETNGGSPASMMHMQHDGMAGMPHDSQAIAKAETQAIEQRLQHEADASAAHSLVRYDIEVSGFPSSHCGHLVLLQLREQQYPGTRGLEDWPSWNMPILRWAKAQGAITGYAHSAHGLVVDSTELPNYLIPAFTSMGANEFIADVTHPGVIDLISGCDLWPFAELNIWYHTLNCGYLTAFAGETDFPCITDKCVGGGRSYVALANAAVGDEGYAQWLQGLLHGSSYFGDGRSHIFQFKVDGRPASKTPVDLAGPKSVQVTALVCARLEPQPTKETQTIQHASPYDKPCWHVERARVGDTRNVPVELIVNGQPVARTLIVADGSLQPIRFSAEIEQSSWIALRVYPSSHTNPIIVTIQGAPVRGSRRSAEWCRKSVDVCWEQKRKRIRPSELEAAAAAYDHARSAYDRILAETAAP